MVLLLASLAIGATAGEPREIDAEKWRKQRLATLAERIQKADSDDERLEYVARESWLRRWKPGQMSPAAKEAPAELVLVEEPRLETLSRPGRIDPNVWQQMITLQRRLHSVDNDAQRKENVRTTIGLAQQLEQLLCDQFPSAPRQLTSPTAWVLAYTRYRLGRALAYRELPSVRAGWPITDPDRYEAQLTAAYQRLIDQAGRDRPEFILLPDRMLRRAGKRGLALELLEVSQQSIDPRWYLKKRRDLLQELGWDPPYQEAARLYLAAGYRD
ncbi:MAG: hypothetical protein ACF788_11965 [Novipirellula sp. JB048]